MYVQIIDTPCGITRISATDTGISGIVFVDDDSVSIEQPNSWTQQAADQLLEYFAGYRTCFDLPLDAKGTDFQHSVWRQLLAIPFGETRSYSDIAIALNNPNAVRAVGLANGKNPISIVVPCHRVIGKNGTLTGYAGGLPRKQQLLELEGRVQRQCQ